MFNSILFPLDRSQEANQAIAIVVELVNKYSAKLLILSVLEPDDDATTLLQLLSEAKDTFTKVGITAETRLEQGNPAFTICDVADEIAADLIIMGSRGMSVSEEHPDGSISQKVVNLSPCPVLVVP
jgi:nucleotide-binding universal stress UspA family protein